MKANTSVQMGGIVTELREKEKQIQADLFDHIVTHDGNYTVIELGI